MSIDKLDYRPAVINFDFAFDNSAIPENIGKFETLKEAADTIAATFTAVNQAVTLNRYLDPKEKAELRAEYQEILEDQLPILERKYVQAQNELASAKENAKARLEALDVSISEAKDLAVQVKKGVTEIKLGDTSTWRVPYRGKYYFYTYIDKQLRLCAIKDIPDAEKSDLFNVEGAAKNDEVVETNFGKSGVKVTLETENGPVDITKKLNL